MGSLEGRTIGFIGLGLMGRPMALNLHAAGARLIINNRSQDVVRDLAVLGMTPAPTPARRASVNASATAPMVSPTMI